MYTLVSSVLVVWLAVYGAVRFARMVNRMEAKNDAIGESTRRWLETVFKEKASIPVTGYWCSYGGDDIRLDLGEHGNLRIRCFWPRPVEVVALTGAFFDNEVGWVIDAKAPNDDRVRYYAWNVVHRAL